MKIAIDARLQGETGVGRYIRNLIKLLGNVDTKNQYTVYLLRKDYEQFHLPNARWGKKIANVRWHTLTEQFVMLWLYLRDKPDIVHVPYFNAPILYWGKFIVTIHDLTILHADTGNAASTLPYWKYALRRIGYRIVLWMTMKRASHIITVSDTVRQDIRKSFTIRDKDITVTYEGIDDMFLQTDRKVKSGIIPTDPYFLYVGNVYPHKNIEVLLNAFRMLQKKVQNPIKLLFVGPNDYFYSKLHNLVQSLSMADCVEIHHGVDDRRLGELYTGAVALVFPSRMEGFGLPALEALSHGCRVIASDIPVFREILGTHANYADTTTAESLSRMLNEVLYAKFDKREFRKSIVPFLSQYNWRNMAKQTLSIYDKFA